MASRRITVLKRVNFGNRKYFQEHFGRSSMTSNLVPRCFSMCTARLLRVRLKKGVCSVHVTFRGSQQCQTRNLFTHSKLSYIVNVKTGDQLQAGTDANVKLVLHSESGEKSDAIPLDYMFRDDFERGQLDTFQLKNIGHLKDIHKIELWRDDSGIASDWFVDYIEIEDVDSRKRFMFPLFRWIKAHKHYIVRHMDNCLPQFDPEQKYRREELEAKRKEYGCYMKIAGGPAQVFQISFETAVKTPSTCKPATLVDSIVQCLLDGEQDRMNFYQTCQGFMKTAGPIPTCVCSLSALPRIISIYTGLIPTCSDTLSTQPRNMSMNTGLIPTCSDTLTTPPLNMTMNNGLIPTCSDTLTTPPLNMTMNNGLIPTCSDTLTTPPLNMTMNNGLIPTCAGSLNALPRNMSMNTSLIPTYSDTLTAIPRNMLINTVLIPTCSDNLQYTCLISQYPQRADQNKSS